MAINSVVIRFLPYDIFETGGYIGVSRRDLVDNGLQTAVYPGYEYYTDLSTIYDAPQYGAYSAMRYGDAGLTGPTREFEFITLAEDGTTGDPIDDTTTNLIVIYSQVYAGGVIEVGAYIDGEYTILAAVDLGIPYDFDSGWTYAGVRNVELNWEVGPTPGFWTDLQQSIEIT